MNKYASWNDLLSKNKFVELTPTKGFYVYLRRLMSLINLLSKKSKKLLENFGHLESSYPVLGEEKSLAKEKKFLEGFSMETFKIENQPCYLRRTSEAIIYPALEGDITFKNKLPLLLYQVGRVFRKETKETRPLIRNREIKVFFEAHTFHKKGEAIDQIRKNFSYVGQLLSWARIKKNCLALVRSEEDKFRGAKQTFAFDYHHPTYGILQVATTHNYEDNFSKNFKIYYPSPKNSEKNTKHTYVDQTTTGWSERILAAVIMHNTLENSRVYLPHLEKKIALVYLKSLEGEATFEKLLSIVPMFLKNYVLIPEQEIRSNSVEALLDSGYSYVLCVSGTPSNLRLWVTFPDDSSKVIKNFEELKRLVREKKIELQKKLADKHSITISTLALERKRSPPLYKF